MAYSFEFICFNAIDIVQESTSLTFQNGITYNHMLARHQLASPFFHPVVIRDHIGI